MMISEDDTYIYDIAGDMTCASRRGYCAQIALAVGKKLAPLSPAGNYIAYPYSSYYHYVGMKAYLQSIVFESEAMSRTALTCQQDLRELVLSDYKAAAFCYRDDRGEKVSPIESYGTWYPVATYRDKTGTRFPYIADFLHRKCFIFSSLRELKENISMIIHLCKGNIATVIAQPDEEKKGQVFEYRDIDDAGFLSEDNYNKSARQLMIEWFAEDPSRKTQGQIQQKFSHLSRADIHNILLYLPLACPFESPSGEIEWSLSEDYDLPGQLGVTGLSSFLQGTELKNSIVTGDLEYDDPADADLGLQLKIIQLLGFEVAAQCTIRDGKIRRIFRVNPEDIVFI